MRQMIRISEVDAVTAIALRMRRSFDLKNRRNRQRLIANTIGLFILVVMIFPVYWMVATAFKPPRDILRFDPKWFRRRPRSTTSTTRSIGRTSGTT